MNVATTAMPDTPPSGQATPAQRRSAARLLRGRTAAVARGWAQRHGDDPDYREAALAELASWDRYAPRFAEPLIGVLARAVMLDDPALLHVYVNERLRFVGENDADGQRAAWRAMLIGDVAALAEDLAIDPADPRLPVLRAAMEGAHAALLAEGEPVRIAFVGDCLMTEIQSFLRPAMARANLRLDARHLYFSARLGAALDADEILATVATHRVDLLALSFFTFEGLPLYTALIRDVAAGRLGRDEAAARADALLGMIDALLRELRAATDTTILLHGCSGLPLNRWRRAIPGVPAMTKAQAAVARRLDDGLRQMSQGFANMLFVDEAGAMAAAGARAAAGRLLPWRMTRRALFHPSRLGPMLAPHYALAARAQATLGRAKVLLVDFDHTLWRGVMAEGPVEHDVAGQRLLRRLKDAGILLVSVSKNNADAIRWEEMVLQPDDFVLHKIGWDLKAQSVLSIAEQLNLDPAAFVLIDDNPVERDLVAMAVPGVRVLDPLDPDSWAMLEMMLALPVTGETEEARRRTAMYREAAQRREAVAAPLDYAAMMGSLALKVGWRRATAADVERVHELCSRTNQFNTTTIRYSVPELQGLIADPAADVFVATLRDKFGSLGIVGVAITALAGGAVRFDDVVMSCRAMGFGLETQLLRGPMLAHPGVARAVGLYVPTDRNGPCADLFARHGFVEEAPGRWTLSMGDAGVPALPDWLTLMNDAG